jgi:hypothetical protein
MHRIILAGAALAALALASSVSAQAPATGPGAAVRQACAADAAKLCPDKTGPDRRQCMMDNKDKLSDACKTAIAAAMQQMQQGGGGPHK